VPDALVLKNGQRVQDADSWWKQRRPEILEDFYAEVYGRIPGNTPKITWEVTTRETDTVRTKTIIGHIDNSAYPEATPSIEITLTLPAKATAPVPVMVVVSSGGSGGPQRGAAPAARGTPPAAAPAAVNAPGAPPANRGGGGPAGPTPMQQVLARGWGYATYNTSSVQQDSAAGLTRGIIGLVNKGQPRPSADQWGTLTAWTWGLSRAIDYFETDKDVDTKRLGVEGHSRWGKTALWAAAQDQRWGIVYASCSGEGGAKLFRRNYGETTDNIAGSYWMAASFRKYGGHWNDLPVDSNELIALVAPRPAFVTGATQDPWSDPRGEFLAAVGAGPVYRLLGKNDLGATEMPVPNVPLISGDVAFREHVGAHTDIPDWPVFLDYASKYFAAPAVKN
ncbi:MAG: acetylxylan esterase, partial [Verrucomicrobiota bacterium]